MCAKDKLTPEQLRKLTPEEWEAYGDFSDESMDAYCNVVHSSAFPENND
jgi:hypothetical protein